jgi:hypothetical protein
MNHEELREQEVRKKYHLEQHSLFQNAQDDIICIFCEEYCIYFFYPYLVLDYLKDKYFDPRGC